MLCWMQYNLPFYLQYLAKWPEYCLVAEAPGQQCMGYILGKAEGVDEGWHGHVTAVTVAPEFRSGHLCIALHACMQTPAHRWRGSDLRTCFM